MLNELEIFELIRYYKNMNQPIITKENKKSKIKQKIYTNMYIPSAVRLTVQQHGQIDYIRFA